MRWWEISDHQWGYVLFFTVYCAAMANSPWGFASFPAWYTVALIGRHT